MPEHRSIGSFSKIRSPDAHVEGVCTVFWRASLDIGVAAGDFRLAGLAQSTMSAHLVTLSGAELIIANKVGQWIFNRRNELTIQLFVRQLEVDL
jgi:DNA-binding transcriptional ArsR family regulator